MNDVLDYADHRDARHLGVRFVADSVYERESDEEGLLEIVVVSESTVDTLLSMQEPRGTARNGSTSEHLHWP